MAVFVLVALAALSSDPAGAAAPGNDDMANSTVIVGSAGKVEGSTVDATEEEGEPDHAGNPGGASVWYEWRAPADDGFVFDTCLSDPATSFDTLLAIYAVVGPGELAPVVSDDDGCGLQSRVILTATAGTVYRIAVDGANDGLGPARGPLVLRWVQVPANDAFAAAEPVAGTSGTVAGSNVGATRERGEPAHAGNPGGSSVWYQWPAPKDTEVTFDTCGSDFDTLLAVYSGDALLDLQPVASNDDSCAQQSSVTFTVTAGTVYRIAVDGFVAVEQGDGFAADSGGLDDPTGSAMLNWRTALAEPTLSTQAQSEATLGGKAIDTAVLADGSEPTGTITFSVFGSDDVECVGKAVFTSTVSVDGNGSYVSEAFTPTTADTYHWVAAYNGDGENSPVRAPCFDPDEITVVPSAAPGLTTAATPTATLGDPISDTATLTDGFNPSGTIVFMAFGPDDPNCAGTATAESAASVEGNGVYRSASFTPTEVGTYLWVASYSGDGNNAAVTLGCGDPSEVSVVSPPTTSSTTTTLPRTTTTTAPTTTTTLPPTTTTSPVTTTTSTTSTTTTLPRPSTTATTVPRTTTTASPTKATWPPGTTTTLATVRAEPPVAATVRRPSVTTTRPPATTTTVPAPATVAPAPATTTTTAAPAPLPRGGPSLDARSPDDRPSGPPGVDLDVSGGGYARCDRVYFFFDGARIGVDEPDATGFVDADGLAVPGDTEPGRHRVTSSCDSSGEPTRASTSFLVTDAATHRTAFVTSLAQPDQVELGARKLAGSAAAAMGLVLLFAFPFQLFNSTVEENYSEIRAWFRLPVNAVDAVAHGVGGGFFLALTVLAAITLGFLSPDFGLDTSSLVLVVAFTVALLVMSLGFRLPADIISHRRTGDWGRLYFLPGTLLVSVVLVVLSRTMHFQPGYFYGALGGIGFAGALTQRTRGRVTAANWVWALTLSVAAWLARVPVSEAAGQPDASLWWIGLEACLALIFLWGVEGLVVAMLPMRFLDGRKVLDWSRTVWAVLMFLGVFATFHLLLAPNSGYVGKTSGEVAVGVLALFLGFGAVSVGLWAYFNYRPPSWVPARARLGVDD